jgi:soluble lytic murein transglycosylase
MVALVGAAWATVASAAPEPSQREDYLAAVQAARQGNLARAKQLLARLEDYPLRGYVEYELLKERLATTPPATIRRFLEENPDTPIADALRKRWLRQLAKQEQWDTFLREYRDIENDPELQCLRLTQLLRPERGTPQAPLMTEIEQLWFTGRPLPAACDPVFAAWKRAGHMTTEKIWERVRLAMENRQLGLAGELARYLDPAERIWVTRWQAMHRDPPRELEHLNYPIETPTARAIVRHGIVRLARRDPEAAMEQWQKLKAHHRFLGEDENYVLRHLGIAAAQNHLPVALEWLSKVSADGADETLHLWRVRAALRAGDWAAARGFIAGLTEEQQRQPQWRYWNARVLEAAGQRDDDSRDGGGRATQGAVADAQRLFTDLARERGYYGFLAADRLGESYSMQHAPIEASPDELSAMYARRGIQMAQELYATGQTVDARRQWNWTTRTLSNRELQVAALVARQWGWHDRAILTVGRSRHLDDIELRFPLVYRETIETNANRARLDPGWVYGVVRQESAFMTDARSHAGALGLMQLMPQTGRLTGQRLGLRAHSQGAILNVENNLRLGVTYLKEVLDRNAGHQTLATASYNAGPHRVVNWMPAKALDADIWIETIPFNETREYVKNVLSYSAIYDYRLGQTPTRLTTRMPVVASGNGENP